MEVAAREEELKLKVSIHIHNTGIETIISTVCPETSLVLNLFFSFLSFRSCHVGGSRPNERNGGVKGL